MPHRKPAGELTPPPLGFDGGYNYLDQSRVRPHQLVSGRNWFRDEDEVVRPRPGNKVWNSSSLGAAFDGLWEYRPSSGTNRLIALAGGSLFKGDDATKSFSLLLTGLTSGKRGYLAQAQDLVLVCNGTDIPRVSNATDIFRLGIVHPAAAPTVALVAVAGNLPLEAHNYRYTYIRKEGGVKVRESNPSAESATVTPVAGSQQIDVTVVASTDAQVTNIHLYRKSATSVLEYKFVAELTNTGQTYRDNIAVGSLGGFAFWEKSGGQEDHGYPPADLVALIARPHRDGRLYAWGDKGRVYYTRVNQFHYWPGASGGATGTAAKGVSLIIGEDDGDDRQAALSEGDDALFLKRQHVYRLLGDGPSKDDGTVGSWRVEQVPSDLGCAAPASAAIGPAGAFWLSDQGMVQVDRRSGLPVLIGEEIQPWVEKSTDITKAVGWVFKWWYFLSLPMSGGKREVHAYDARNRSWWPCFDMDATAFTTRETGVLVWGGILEVDKPALGVVYEWDQQVSDNGQAVTAELTTRLIDARPRWWKLARKTFLACEGNPGAKFTARIIPDQSTSYVERELKLNGITGIRMLKPFPGTKRLQGWAFQFYLKSANLTARPAVYYWQQEIHTFNREALHAAAFTETFTDPDPTVAIVDGTFSGGTHTNTQAASGVVLLADENTWAVSYTPPAGYQRAGSLLVIQNKLVGAIWDSTNDDMYLLKYDGASWAAPVLALTIYKPNNAILAIVVKVLLARGNTLYIGGAWDAVTQTKIRKTSDLSTISDYSAQTFFEARLVDHGGLLWACEWHAGAGAQVARDDGAGNFTFIADPGPSPNYSAWESYDSQLYAVDLQNLRAWDGSTWTTKVAVTEPAAATLRRFSVNDKLYIGEQKGRIEEWDRTTLVSRLNPVLGVTKHTNVIEELIEPDGRKALYAGVDDTVYRSYDGMAWSNLQTPVAGQVIVGLAVYKGKKYAGLGTGHVYTSTFYKTSGTYRLDERDLGSVKTTAQVTVTATVPSGTTLQTRIGYASAPGGPYTFTAWDSRLAYQVGINGRYIVVEFQMTGDGTATPQVDEFQGIFP